MSLHDEAAGANAEDLFRWYGIGITAGYSSLSFGQGLKITGRFWHPIEVRSTFEEGDQLRFAIDWDGMPILPTAKGPRRIHIRPDGTLAVDP